MEAPGQPSVVEPHPTLEYQINKRRQDIYGGPLVMEALGQPSVEELWSPTLP